MTSRRLASETLLLSMRSLPTRNFLFAFRLSECTAVQAGEAHGRGGGVVRGRRRLYREHRLFPGIKLRSFRAIGNHRVEIIPEKRARTRRSARAIEQSNAIAGCARTRARVSGG